MLNFRSPPSLTAALDSWVAAQPEPRPSRSEAIRFALREWLASQSAAVKSPALPPPSPAFQPALKTSASAKALANARKSRGRPGERHQEGEARMKAPGLRVRNYRNRQSRCYELAYNYLIASDDTSQWALVHGEVGDPAFGHAWLERRDEVYDAVSDKVFVKSEFATRFRATISATYSKLEAAHHALASGHSGPWEMKAAGRA